MKDWFWRALLTLVYQPKFIKVVGSKGIEPITKVCNTFVLPLN